MLTIFSIPKAFKGHIGTIQRNAITSWTLLCPRPEIILFGNDEGTEEVSRELGLRHEPEIATNEYGTPLLSGLFSRAERVSHSPLLCYVNADILLLSDFQAAVQKVASQMNEFLIVSKRINLDVEAINFSQAWEAPVKKQAADKGTDGQHTAIDVFVFPRGTYARVPDFGIGRLWFDQWLIKAAREKPTRVVDLSLVAPVLHQNHDYNHVTGGANWIWKGKEAERNLDLYGGVEHAYTLLDATHELTPSGNVRWIPFRRLRFELWKHAVANTASLRHRLGPRRRKSSSAQIQAGGTD